MLGACRATGLLLSCLQALGNNPVVCITKKWLGRLVGCEYGPGRTERDLFWGRFGGMQQEEPRPAASSMSDLDWWQR